VVDPLIGTLALVSVAFLGILLLATSGHLYVLLTAAYVIFAPKLALLSIPGTSVGLRGEDLLIGLLLVRVLIDLSTHRYTLPPIAKRITWLLLALIPIGLVGIIIGVQTGSVESPGVALLFLARRYEYFVLFLAAFMYLGPKVTAQRSLLRMLEVSAYFHFGFALLQYAGVLGGFRFGSYRVDVTDRVISTFAGSYELCAYLVLLLPMFMWRIMRTPRKLSGLVAAALIWATVWLSQGRIAIIAAAVVTLGMFLVLARNKLVPFVVGVPAVIIAWVAVPSSAVGESRFSTINIAEMWTATVLAYQNRNYDTIDRFKKIQSNVDDRSYALRIDRWFSYLDGQLELNPFFGLGPSAGGENMDNNYLRLLFEFGFVGLIVVILLLVSIGKAARSVPPGPWRAIATWGGIALLIQATFIDVFEASKVAEPFWLILGVGVSLSVQAATTKEPPPPATRADGGGSKLTRASGSTRGM
jgi:hypothetical protein